MAQIVMKQLSIEYNPDITKVYPEWVQYIRRCMEDYCADQGKSLGYLAVDMGLNPNTLYKKLTFNPNCKNKLTVTDVDTYIAVSGELKVLDWIYAKHYDAMTADDIDRRIAELKQMKKERE